MPTSIIIIKKQYFSGRQPLITQQTGMYGHRARSEMPARNFLADLTRLCIQQCPGSVGRGRKYWALWLSNSKTRHRFQWFSSTVPGHPSVHPHPLKGVVRYEEISYMCKDKCRLRFSPCLASPHPHCLAPLQEGKHCNTSIGFWNWVPLHSQTLWRGVSSPEKLRPPG